MKNIKNKIKPRFLRHLFHVDLAPKAMKYGIDVNGFYIWRKVSTTNIIRRQLSESDVRGNYISGIKLQLG